MNASPATDPTLRGKTILIVEDHPDSQGLLVWTFRNLGARTLTAASVTDAQREIVGHRPDLIIADIALPGGSGFELIAWLRGTSQALGPDIPAIGITAYPDRFPPTSAKGFTAYMRKPLDIGRLCSIVASLLAPRSRPQDV
jgi:CheY-like chemotaxis protein